MKQRVFTQPGSFASISAYPHHIRLAPESDQITDIVFRPFSANSDRIMSRRIAAKASSFNDIVRAQQERFRNFQPKRLGGLVVDYQLEFSRLLNQ